MRRLSAAGSMGEPRSAGVRSVTSAPARRAAAMACAAAAVLTGCASGADTTASGADVARVVADTVASQIDVRPEVDCGDDRIDTADGQSTICLITDPQTALSYDARVRFINPDGIDRFAVDLTVAPEPTQ